MATEAATDTIIRDNAIKQIEHKIKLSGEQLDKVSDNQKSIITQQTNIRNVQTAFQEDIKNKVTAVELNQIIEAKFNEMIEDKMKSSVSIEKFNQLEKQMEISDVEPTVYFTAHANSHFSTSSQIIPFPTIVADNSGYVGATGVIPIKIPGVYHFVITIMKHPHNTLDYGLYHNEKVVCRSMSNDNVKYHMLSCTATISVKSGDTVYVKLYSGQIHGREYSTFTGFRIGNN